MMGFCDSDTELLCSKNHSYTHKCNLVSYNQITKHCSWPVNIPASHLECS
jgi:hypothetical protein